MERKVWLVTWNDERLLAPDGIFGAALMKILGMREIDYVQTFSRRQFCRCGLAPCRCHRQDLLLGAASVQGGVNPGDAVLCIPERTFRYWFAAQGRSAWHRDMDNPAGYRSPYARGAFWLHRICSGMPETPVLTWGVPAVRGKNWRGWEGRESARRRLLKLAPWLEDKLGIIDA